MKCENCGGRISLEDEFCPSCGAVNRNAQKHIKDMRRYQSTFANVQQDVQEATKRYSEVTVRIIMIAVLLIMAILFSLVAMNPTRFVRIGKGLRLKVTYSHWVKEFDDAIEEQDPLRVAYIRNDIGLYRDYDSETTQKQYLADMSDRYIAFQDYLLMMQDPFSEYDTATERLDMLQSSLRGFYGYAGDLKEKRMQKNMTDSEIVYVAALESNVSDLLHTYLGVPYEDMEALSQMSRAKMSVALKNTMKQCMSRWNRQNRGSYEYKKTRTCCFLAAGEKRYSRGPVRRGYFVFYHMDVDSCVGSGL